MDPQNQLVTIKDAATELLVSTDTVRRLVARGVLEQVRISAGRIGIRRSSMDRLKAAGYR